MEQTSLPPEPLVAHWSALEERANKHIPFTTSMIPTVSRCVRLAQRPVGVVKAGVDLVMSTNLVMPEGRSALAPGEFVVKNLYLSLDPAMRGVSPPRRVAAG